MSRRGLPVRKVVGRKVKWMACRECGQHYSKQRLPLHVKERHQGGRKR